MRTLLSARCQNPLTIRNRRVLARSMFCQRINKQTGESEWVVVEAPGEGGSEDASAALVAASSYLDMLTDKRRNLAYWLAIERAVRHSASPPDAACKPPQQQATTSASTACPVLDIGTGTGLLAMMAARALAEANTSHTFAAQPPAAGNTAGSTSGNIASAPAAGPSVIACELFPPMAHLAQRVVAANALQDQIQVVLKRSDELTVGAESAAGTPAPGHTPEDKPDRLTQQHQATARTRRHNTTGAQQGADSSTAAPGADLPCKAGLIVTEIFDSELLGEGVLPTMRHAVPNLLSAGGAVVPARARVWGQVVECPLLWSMSSLSSAPATSPTSIPHATPGVSPRTDSMAQEVVAALALLDTQATASAPAMSAAVDGSCSWQKLHELHVDVLHDAGLLRPLGPAVQLLDFDFAAPPAGDTEVHGVHAAIDTHGTAHALVVWWALDMDPHEPGSLLLSTAPKWVEGAPAAGGDGGPLHGVHQEWRDHWGQCWVRLGSAHAAQPLSVHPGQVLSLGARHDDVSIQIRVEEEPQTVLGHSQHTADADTAPAATQPNPNALSTWLSPCRVWQAQDWQQRWALYERALLPSLCPSTSAAPPEVVCVGAGPVLPLLTARMLRGAGNGVGSASARVTVLVDGGGPQAAMAAASQLLDVAQLLKVASPGPYLKRLRHVAAALGTQLAMRGSDGSSAATAAPLLLLSEPHYSQAEGGLPWGHLRCWSEFRAIRAAHPGRAVAVSPGRAVLRAVAVALPQLWRSRHALGQIQGLDLTPANHILGVVGCPGDGSNGPCDVDIVSAAEPAQAQQGTPRETMDGGQAASGAGSAAGGSPTPEQLPPLPYAVWQCGGGYVEHSDRVDLFQLDLAGPVGKVEGKQVLRLTPGAQVHAVVLWLDYDLVPRTCHDGADADHQQVEGHGAMQAGGDPEARTSLGTAGVPHDAAMRGTSQVQQGLWLDCGPERSGGPCSTVQAVMLLPQPLYAPAVAHDGGQHHGIKCSKEDAGSMVHGANGVDRARNDGSQVWLEVDAAFDPDDGEVEVGVRWGRGTAP